MRSEHGVNLLRTLIEKQEFKIVFDHLRIQHPFSLDCLSEIQVKYNNNTYSETSLPHMSDNFTYYQ